MATYNQQTAVSVPVSGRQRYWLVFAMAAFPVHVWAIINIMREVPAWILRLSLWDTVGVISYTLFYSLLETVLFFFGLMLLSVVVPRRWMGTRLVPVATAVAFITAIWFIILHYNSTWIDNRAIVPLALWAVTFLLLLAGAFLFIYRSTAVANRIQDFAQRLAVLSGLYLFVDIICLIIIVIRNF